MFKGLKALLAGLLAGVGLGVLFSPKKGKDVRKSIKSEVDEGGTGLGAIKDTIVDMGKDIGETCKECYEEVSDSDEYKEGTGKLKKYAKNAKKEATKAYKKHVPVKTRNKIKKVVKKVKKKLKE
ncbi:MAG: hypothetical protein ABID64_03850 [Nitrospirota bacterium]